MAKVLCVLYDDPVDGYPHAYARDGIPQSSATPTARALPTPEGHRLHAGRAAGQRLRRARAARVPGGRRPRAGRDLRQGRPGLGVRAGAAGRRGRDLPAVLARLPDRRADRQGAEAQAGASPRASARTTSICRRRSSTASRLPRSPTRNSISVAEHVVMMILALVRNYIPSYQWVIDGGWNIADCVAALLRPGGHAVGTVAAGRIGSAVLRRLQAVRRRSCTTPTATASPRTSSGSWRHLPRERRVAGGGVRRGHDQRAAASRDRAPVRRQAARRR